MAGPEFVVPFDVAALRRRRAQLRPLLLVSTLVSTVLACAVAALGLAAAALAWWLALVFLVLAGLVGYLTVMSWLGFWRTAHWSHTPPPRIAIRMTADGIWLGTGGAPGGFGYPWSDLTGLTVRSPMFRTCLFVGLRRGAKPDLPLVLGLDEADVFVKARRLLGIRRPRLMLDDVPVKAADIGAAAFHYSAGRVGLN